MNEKMNWMNYACADHDAACLGPCGEPAAVCWSCPAALFFYGRLVRSWSRPQWSSWWTSSGGSTGGLTSASWEPCMCSIWSASPCAASTALSRPVVATAQIPETSPYSSRSCSRWLLEGMRGACSTWWWHWKPEPRFPGDMPLPWLWQGQAPDHLDRN